MNEVNFLNSISEKKYILFYRWTKISTFLFFSSLISIGILHIKQIYQINLLKNEKKTIEHRLINFDDFVKEKSKIKEYKIEVQKQLAKFQKISSVSSRTFVFNFLKDLVKIVPEDLYLQDFEFDSKIGVILKGYSTAVYTVNNFVQKINKLSLVENAKLEYLKYKEYPIDNEIDDIEELPILHEFFIKIKIKK